MPPTEITMLTKAKHATEILIAWYMTCPPFDEANMEGLTYGRLKEALGQA